MMKIIKGLFLFLLLTISALFTTAVSTSDVTNVLPVIGQSNWGNPILLGFNQTLDLFKVSHTENGTLKNNSVQDFMLNLSAITLADFTNDANFLTIVGNPNIVTGTITANKLNLTDITLSDFTNDFGYSTVTNSTIQITESQISDLKDYVEISGDTMNGNLLINGKRTSNATGYEQYLKVTGDLTAIGTVGGNAKTWVIQSTATRQAGANVLNGDFDDVGVKVSMTNKAIDNAVGYILRGIDVSSVSRDGGKVTTLSGGHISATQKASSPVDTLTGLTLKVESDSPNTAPTSVYGLNVEYDNVAGTPANSAGIRVFQNSDYYVSYPLAGLLIDNGAEAMKWQYGLYIDDNTINKADIKLSKSASEPSTCDATTEGAIYYNSGGKHFYGCDGTNWKQLDN